MLRTFAKKHLARPPQWAIRCDRILPAVTHCRKATYRPPAQAAERPTDQRRRHIPLFSAKTTAQCPHPRPGLRKTWPFLPKEATMFLAWFCSGGSGNRRAEGPVVLPGQGVALAWENYCPVGAVWRCLDMEQKWNKWPSPKIPSFAQPSSRLFLHDIDYLTLNKRVLG